MENNNTALVAAAPKPNLQLVSKNINNWMVTLSDDVKCHQHESSLRIRDTFKGMSINTMIKFHGAKRSDVLAIVDLQLVRFLNSINITNPLTDFQKSELVMTMVERYPHETLNDFMLMFRMVKHGYFGPIYNRLDITVISEYMTKYLESKAFERENMEQQLESAIIADVKFLEQKEFANEKEYQEWVEKWMAEKQKWYTDKLVLADKLNDIQKRYERRKRFGIIGVTGDDPKKEAEYQKILRNANEKWRKEVDVEIQKQTANDTNTRGSMGGNADPGSNENVPVPDGTRRDDVEPIQRAGSSHREQGDGIPS